MPQALQLEVAEEQRQNCSDIEVSPSTLSARPCLSTLIITAGMSIRKPVYHLFTRRRDTLFDLTDALLTTGLTLSPAHLSLASSFQRG